MTDDDISANTKSIGRIMLFAAWILIFVGLVAFFGKWEQHQYNPNQQIRGIEEGGVREITLEANRLHHYVANGEINGRPVVFLVDTGATAVSVPEDLANDIGLIKGFKGYAQTANGTVAVWATTIDELTLGNLVFYDIRASINPGMEGNEVLLGMSALKQVELEQKNNKLTLRQYLE